MTITYCSLNLRKVQYVKSIAILFNRILLISSRHLYPKEELFGLAQGEGGGEFQKPRRLTEPVPAYTAFLMKQQ